MKFLVWADFQIFRLLTRGISKHPQVADYATNAGVGVGNGMARTSLPLYFWTVLFRFRSSKTLIDLGAGEGTALYLAKLLKTHKFYIGIEADASLVEIAKMNLGLDSVLEGYFETVTSQITNEIQELNVDVFAFNPGGADPLVKALKNLATLHQVTFFYRNPVNLKDILEIDGAEIMSFKRNFAVVKIARSAS